MNTAPRTNEVQSGNAHEDGVRGWFVGHFVDETLGLRHSPDLELKWAVHKAGDERPEWATGEARTTVSILITGKWEMIFRDKSVQLKKPGDYCMWGKGTDHKWRALTDSTILTVRWPSVGS